MKDIAFSWFSHEKENINLYGKSLTFYIIQLKKN
jgi:hypothetical protein